MKSQSHTFQNSNSRTSFNAQSSTRFVDAEFSPEMQSTTELIDLHYKYDDEPDFDCEFLHSSALHYDDNESTIDPDQEEDLTDHYNDRTWDMDMYDPYLESTYY